MNAYLCGTGIDSPNKLRCQRMALPDLTLGPVAPETAKAIFQNTVSVLLNPSTRPTNVNSPSMIAVGGGCSYDEETGEGDCSGGDGGGDGGGWGGEGDGGDDPGPSGPYTDIPDPGPGDGTESSDISGDMAAEIDGFVESDFASGMLAFAANAANKPPMQCTVVISQCRDSCSNMQTLGVAGCTAFGAAVGAALSPAIGVAAGFYCAGRVAIAGEKCKAGCNTPVVQCTP